MGMTFAARCCGSIHGNAPAGNAGYMAKPYRFQMQKARLAKGKPGLFCVKIIRSF